MERPKRPQESAEGRKSGGHGAKSEALREQVILALLSGRSILAAAKRANVSERTIRRWLEEPAFKAEYDRARRSVFDVGINRVQALTGKAVETLEKLLTVNKAPAVQLGAARTITEIAIHERNAEAILRKLEEVEAVMNRGESGRS